MKARPSRSSEYLWQSLLLAAILLLAFGLRIYRLDAQSLRGDEAASAVYAGFSISEIVEISRVADPHPPLFYGALHLWQSLTGLTEFALRFWALLPGVLAVSSLFALVRRLLGSVAAIFAAFLLAVNSFHIYYSQDLRSYTWLVLLGLWASYALWQALHRGRRFSWGVYTLALVFLFYLHYYALFLLAFHGMYVLWRGFGGQRSVVGGRRQVILTWLGAVFLAGLAFLPWLSTSWQFVSGFTGDFAPALPHVVLWRGLQAFSGGLITQPPSFAAWTAAVMLLAGVGSWVMWRQRRDAAVFLLLYLALPFIGVMLLTLRGQAFTERYLIAALPAYLSLTAFGWQWLIRRDSPFNWVLGAAAFLLILGLNANAWFHYQFDESLAKSPPWREVLNYIAKKSTPGDALIFTAPLPTITYYNANRLPTHLVPYSVETTPAEMEADLEAFLQRYKRLWLLPTQGLTPVAEQVTPWLDKHAVRVDQTFFRILHTNLYESPAYFLTTMTAQPTLFANGIHLDGFRFEKGGRSPQKIKPGETLNVTLVWRVDAPVAVSYTVFTHLVGPDGALYGQWDNPPGRGTYPTTNWPPGEQIFDSYQIPVQENAPPGEYRLFVGMYNSADGERLPVLDEAGNPIADHAVLSIPLAVEN